MTQDSVWTYSYDAENRLKTLAKAGQTITMDYDYMGRRIRKTVTGTGAYDIKFLWTGWKLAAELAADGDTVNKVFIWGRDFSDGQGNAGGAGSLLAQIAGTTISYAVPDAFGTIVGYITSANGGKLVAAVEYSPYGKGVNATGAWQDYPIGFSGQYMDWEPGLVYYGMRHYAPKHGRFINRDPIEEQGGNNLYGFVGNSPYRGWDVLGLDDHSDRDQLAKELEEGRGAWAAIKAKHEAEEAARKAAIAYDPFGAIVYGFYDSQIAAAGYEAYNAAMAAKEEAQNSELRGSTTSVAGSPSGTARSVSPNSTGGRDHVVKMGDLVSLGTVGDDAISASTPNNRGGIDYNNISADAYGRAWDASRGNGSDPWGAVVSDFQQNAGVFNTAANATYVFTAVGVAAPVIALTGPPPLVAGGEALVGSAKIAAANVALRAGIIGTASAGGYKAINTFKLIGYDAVRNNHVRVVYAADRAREGLAAAARSVAGPHGGPPTP